MLLDVFDTVIGAINQFAQNLGLSWISVIAFSMLFVTLVISFFVTVFSAELKTVRAVEKLNSYLESNPFINDENLVEFNKLMKKIPAPMRVQWQQFMVNRDKKPSEFFTEENCIDKPFKASSYKNHIVIVRALIVCISIISLILSVGAISNVTSNLAVVIAESLLLPLVVTFIGEIYLIFLKTRRNNSIADLYLIYSNFQHALDRAVTTLPDYVDYEILFTRKEIVSGIPVLQEYLQQRALFEQEQIKKAKESQVEHEDYDFSSLGVNGSLVMERAMRECEYYLGNRKRILAEISELEGSRDLLEKSYDEKNKTNQRKLRDIQESLDRLKEKLDSTTNIIVGNDLRKQRENEIQKQRQLEREIEEDNNKFEADKKALEKQIAEKKAEIDGYRKTAEVSLNGEFKTYADKIFADLKSIADNQVKAELDGLKEENEKLQLSLEEADKAMAEKTVMYDEKLQVIEDYANKIADQEKTIADLETFKNEFNNEIVERDKQINSKDKEIFNTNKTLESRKLELEKKNKEIENLKEELKDIKHKKQVEVYRYFDVNGNEFYVDENGNPYYVDENGNSYYDYPKSAQEVSQDSQLVDSDLQNYGLPAEDENTEQKYTALDKTESEVSKDQNIDYDTEISEFEELAKNVDVGDTTEVPFDGFEDDNLEEQTKNDSMTQKLKESDLLGKSHLDIIKQLEEVDKLLSVEDDPSRKAKPVPEFHKPVEDFKWENSNSPEHFEEETVKEEKVDSSPSKEQAEEKPKAQKDEAKKQTVKKSSAKKQSKSSSKKSSGKKQTAKSTSKKTSAKKSTTKKSAPKKSTAKKSTTKKQAPKKLVNANSDKSKEIDEIDRQIESQNRELEQQTKNLSAQLEETKAIADNKVKSNDDSLTGDDFSWSDFNEQLKEALKDIDKDNGSKK